MAWKDDDLVGDIRNTKQFRELAAFLRERTGQEGVKLVAGEAEKILGDRVNALASQLRVTQRTALGYVSEDNLELLARELGSLAEEYDDAVETAEPVIIKITDAGRVIAALGMAVKLAAEHIEGHQAEAAGIATDGADALVGRQSGHEHCERYRRVPVRRAASRVDPEGAPTDDRAHQQRAPARVPTTARQHAACSAS